MRIKELRKENKKTQQEIAEFLNITQATYGRYELDAITPSFETLCRLADYYGVSLDYLVGRNGNEFSYLNDTEKSLISDFRKLSTYNQAKILGEVAGVLLTQN